MSLPRAWLTPDAPPATATFCRRLRFPKEETWTAIVEGCLLLLTETGNWEQFGTMTPDQAAEVAWDFWQDFVDETDVCMIGAIIAYATALPPAGALYCDGASYLRVDYPDLYDVLDPVFIIDANSFFVPDLRDRVVVSTGALYAINDAGGANAVTLTVGQMPVHSHTDLGHVHSEIPALPILQAIGVGVPAPAAIPGVGLTGIGSANIQSAGGGGAHENRQPYRALPHAIIAR